MVKRIFSTLLLAPALVGMAQLKVTQLKYSDFDSWQVRNIKESFLIGGNVKQIYEIGKPDTINETGPRKRTDSPWETSSSLIHAASIDKASVTVYPEKRGDGYCLRIESKLEEVKVLGMVNLTCMASGSVFTGFLIEPIESSDNPMQYMMQGVPYTAKPRAIKFDYKAKVGGKRQYKSVSKSMELEGKNEAEVSVVLQRRWEDASGKLHAKRVATAYMRIKESVNDWQNGFELPLQYGDITNEPGYQDYMGVNYKNYPYWGINSKGVRMQISEKEYADPDEMPTHIIIRFSSGYGGAFCGAIGDRLWVDNLKIIE